MLDNAYLMKRISNYVLIIVLVLFTVSVGFWLYHSPYFPIKQVRINGKLQHTSSQVVQEIAKKHIHGSILRADLNQAQKAFAELPWIAQAEVSRLLPDVVEVNLTERVLVARWTDGRLLDKEGLLFHADYDQTLPIFEGVEGTQKQMLLYFEQFQNTLKPTRLTISRLIYTPRSAWSLVLNNGLTVRLGRENEHERLHTFVQSWRNIIEPQVQQLEYVDMRYKDGFAIRQKIEQIAESKEEEHEK